MTRVDNGIYTFSQVSRWLGISPSTVRAWSTGGQGNASRFAPVIQPAGSASPHLSFTNLVELHVLATIRREYKVELHKVRSAIDFLEKRLGRPNPLATHSMLTDGRDLFVIELNKIVNVSEYGQTVIRETIEKSLKRVEHDEDGRAVRLYPFTRSYEESPRKIAIDPRVRFGRPFLVSSGVHVSVVAERHAAGESVKEIASDFETGEEEVSEALRFWGRAA